MEYGEVEPRGHARGVRSEQITYEALPEQFWRSINPAGDGGWFYDRRRQYSTAIFNLNEAQQGPAEASKRAL